MGSYNWTVEKDEDLIRWWLDGRTVGSWATEKGVPDYVAKDRARKLGIPNCTLVDDSSSWSEREDDLLFTAMSIVGEGGSYWGRVSQHVGFRSAKACEERAGKIGASLLKGVTPSEYSAVYDMLSSKKSVREISVALGLEPKMAYILVGRIMELKLHGKDLPE